MVRRQFELDEQTLDEVIKELAALCMRDALRKFSREIRRNHGLDFFTRKGLNSGDGIVGAPAPCVPPNHAMANFGLFPIRLANRLV